VKRINTRLGLIVMMGGLLAAMLIIVGCQSSAGHSVDAAAPTASLPDDKTASKAPPSDSVELEPAMMANVKVEPVRVEASRPLLTATGKVQFNEDQTVRVLAPLPGQVQDLKLRVGDSVQKDQVLFSIKSREVSALVTDYIQSQRDLDLAQKTHTMTKDLFEHQAASKISLQQAEGDLAKAQTHLAQAEEALRVLGLDPKEAEKDGGLRSLIPVHSTLAGLVIERAVTNGQFIQADSTPLLTITDVSSVWVLVDVFERDIHLVHVGQKVVVVATAYPDRRFTATVERIGDKVDPETRTLKVRLLVPNPNLLLKPEMFISASLELSAGTAAMTVPTTAVFTEDSKNYLFAAAGERSFARREVLTAPDGEGRLRVTSGLHSGDRVVTDGALLLNFRQKQQKD
jgi:cobalt-zinc-cadmium efflux system membrane fusion protein